MQKAQYPNQVNSSLGPADPHEEARRPAGAGLGCLCTLCNHPHADPCESGTTVPTFQTRTASLRGVRRPPEVTRFVTKPGSEPRSVCPQILSSLHYPHCQVCRSKMRIRTCQAINFCPHSLTSSARGGGGGDGARGFGTEFCCGKDRHQQHPAPALSLLLREPQMMRPE